MLLGCTEFTKVYLRIKDNPWPYVNLAILVHNARMSDSEVMELLKIANGYLLRVRLEYDRLNEEMNLRKAEKNSLGAEISNAVRTYQNFCDRNLALRNREDELLFSISELETKRIELLRTISGLKQQQAELQENNAYNDNLDSEVISINDVLIPPPNIAINYNPNENETLHYSSSSILSLNEPSS